MPGFPKCLMALLVVSLAFSAAAADVVLTPESALSLPIPTPAPYEQNLQGLASTGAEYLAIWIDRRSTIPPLGFAFGGSPLYVGRLDTLGRMKKPFGTKLVNNVATAALVGLPTGYIKGPRFGTGTATSNYPAPRPGLTGGRTIMAAFGLRF